MKVNDIEEAVIISKEFWNNTGIELEQGCTYSVYVDPEDQEWTDGTVFPQRCKADGFSHPILNVFSYLKRHRQAKWFCLIGCIDKKKETQFKIGLKIENYSPPETGILQCFANDAVKHYKNNSGSMKIKVKRIK